ncbi:MAG: alpha/beta fold hydrolase, partial [Gammaproteobacteria bacterium]|nr:alpha/beta fold hydrolase [Gammaproteobacteria bacterium]
MQREPVTGPCLLLHGWGFDASVMEPLKRVLEQDRSALACDIPGITAAGQTANELQSIAMELANCPVSAGTLIGWSLGGNIAIRMAAQLSGRISALVLICCNPSFVLRPHWPCALDQGSIVGLRSVLAEDQNRAAVEFAGWCALGERSVRKVRRTLSDSMATARTDRSSLDRGLRLLQQLDQRMMLADLDCPVLMLFAEKDRS